MLCLSLQLKGIGQLEPIREIGDMIESVQQYSCWQGLGFRGCV